MSPLTGKENCDKPTSHRIKQTGKEVLFRKREGDHNIHAEKTWQAYHHL